MIQKVNLDDQIYEMLFNSIIQGEWQQGTNIDVNEIANNFEVSRTPVLMAIKRMASDEILTTNRTGKYVVPKYDIAQVRDICKIRLLLEVEAVEIIRENDEKLDLKALETFSKECEKHTASEDVVEARKADLQWHRSLVELAHNDCLTGIYSKVQGQFMVANYLQIYHRKEQQLVAAIDHSDMMNDLKNKRYDDLIEKLKEHINIASNRIVDRMTEAKK